MSVGILVFYWRKDSTTHGPLSASHGRTVTLLPPSAILRWIGWWAPRVDGQNARSHSHIGHPSHHSYGEVLAIATVQYYGVWDIGGVAMTRPTGVTTLPVVLVVPRSNGNGSSNKKWERATGSYSWLCLPACSHDLPPLLSSTRLALADVIRYIGHYANRFCQKPTNQKFDTSL